MVNLLLGTNIEYCVLATLLFVFCMLSFNTLLPSHSFVIGPMFMQPLQAVVNICICKVNITRCVDNAY